MAKNIKRTPNLVGGRLGGVGVFPFEVSKSIHRSVLGSINDFIKTAKWLLENRDHSPFSVSNELNQMLMKAIGYKPPLDALKNWKCNRFHDIFY